MKVEGLSKEALIKSLSPRVMLSNHLLPKGTKMKVNLEDQGRQKVSFTFSQTKKPLQSLFLIPASSDKSVTEPPMTMSQSISDKGQNTDSKTEQKQTPLVPTSAAETHCQTPVSSAANLKTVLAKMHFKKQLINVSVTEEKPMSVVPEEAHSPDLKVLQKSPSKSIPDFPTPQPQNDISDCHSENTQIEASVSMVTPSLKKPAASSGKNGESSSSAEQNSNIYRRKTRSQSGSAPQGSESDGDSVQMSSSCKSVDSKSKTNSDSRSKEVKKSSSSSHVEEKEKSSSKRSENHERSSSYSKTDRDSRHTSSRSSRSDKDRRRTRSRSRSRSRGSRTSSSHSRAERSRGDRGLRSERSYYHDSDRRSRRSSPRRERRRSRSRTDRTRDSSDSEDDHRKTRTRTSDSSRSSAYSSSHKESKSSSYSKAERASKSAVSPHSSELDKRTLASKSERTSKRLSDSDSQRKCSPDLDSSYRKSSSHHKSETNSKSSSSSVHTHSETHEKHQKSSSSDSEANYKGKSLASDKSSSAEESCKNSQKKTSRSDSRPVTPSRSSLKTSGHDRQSNDIFPSPGKAPPCESITALCSQSEKENSKQGGSEHSNEDFKEIVTCTEKSFQETSSKIQETKSGLDVKNENASAKPLSESLKHVNVVLENLTNVKDSLSSNNRSHVNSNAAVLNSCSSNDSIMCSQDEKVVDCPPEPKSPLDTSDIPVTHDVQQNTKPEIVESNVVSTVDKQADISVSLKSDSSCLEPEKQLTLAQQNMDTVKKSSSTTKKSRWDIVGQDNSENDHSQRTLGAETKPTVKKVISVKKIEFSKENSQQDSDNDAIQQEAETHSKPMNQTQISKQEVILDSTSMTDKYKDQSEPFQESTSIDHCDLKLRVSQKTNAFECLHINDKSQVDKAAMMQSWNGDDHEEKSKDSAHKSRLSKRTTLNQEALGGQSEASDSDNSEYDSDCGEAIKRLHSVVVVPKNFTMDTQDTGDSPCAQMNSSELQKTNISLDMNQLNKNNSLIYLLILFFIFYIK